MRSPALLIVVAACGSSTAAGRVELATEEGIVVVRDSQHVLEVPLASTKGLTFAPIDLPEATLPGRVAVVDAEHDYLIGAWITRLGNKRPENIQRWFDDKVDALRRSGQVLANHGTMFAGNHPGRVTDFHVKVRDHEGYERLIAVDIPEHDLDLIVYAVVAAPEPTAAQRVWLDAIGADVAAIRIK